VIREICFERVAIELIPKGQERTHYVETWKSRSPIEGTARTKPLRRKNLGHLKQKI
jgi:hypothetical protein